MSTQVLPVLICDDIDLADLTHLFCQTCGDDIAICGFMAMEGWDEVDDDGGKLCRLCAELVDEPCFRCGEV